MVDRNMRDFQGRLGRIERIHDGGGGFEADGTLGASAVPRRRRRRLLRLPALLALTAVILILLKAGLHAALGPDLYAAKVDLLRAGSDADRAGAWVLQVDPLTENISARIRRLFG